VRCWLAVLAHPNNPTTPPTALRARLHPYPAPSPTLAMRASLTVYGDAQGPGSPLYSAHPVAWHSDGSIRDETAR